MATEVATGSTGAPVRRDVAADRRAAQREEVEHDVGPARRWRIAIVALVLLPIAVAVVRALRNHWFPIGDNALLYIRVRDTFTEHHPFLGSWTSASLIVGEDMNNPGPLQDDLLSPFAHLLSPGPGAAIGVGTMNAAAIVGVSIAARHIGGWAMQRWMLLACAALTWTMGSELLIDIWQAHAMLLPFLLFLVLVVGVGSGRTRCIPWTLAVATLLVQTHVSYAFNVVLFAAVALASWRFAERWAERPLRRARVIDGLRSRTAAWSLGVVAVLWAQPIWEQLFGPGKGNLGRLAGNASGGDVNVGIAQGTQIMASVAALPPWWLRSGFSSVVPSTRLSDTPDGQVLDIPGLPSLALAALAVTALVVALALLSRRATAIGRRSLATACTLAAATLPLAIVCVSLVTVGAVGFALHHIRWLWTYVVFVHVVLVWAVVELVVVERVAAVRRVVTPAIAAIVAVLVVANLPFHAHEQGPVADYDKMPALRRTFHDLEPLRDHAPVLFDRNVRVFEPYSATIMMRLQEMGIEFRVIPEGDVRQLGERRRADGTEPTTLYQFEGVEALTYAGPACPLSITSARTPEEEAAAGVLAETLAGALTSGGLVVDIATLDPAAEADALARLDAARAGDAAAAERIVLDGTLQRWYETGLVRAEASSDTGVADALAEGFGPIGAWVTTAFGLFVTNPTLCPNPPA
jgi:hypothetical protein